MKKVVISALALSMLMGTLAAGCSSGSATPSASNSGSGEEKKNLVIGTSSVSVDLAESGVEALEKMGYTVEIKVFDDYVLPNDALVDGSLDANFYQHTPYMENYNESNGTDIVMLQPLLYNYYQGIYSVKADSLETLPDGGVAGIAQDASNIDNDLRLYAEAGIITLSEQPNSGSFYTVADIMENPHNYEFVQSDHNKYLNMEDYAVLVGSSNTMATAGVDPTENCLYKEVDNQYAQGISVLAENADTQWAKDLIAAYSSEEARANVPASSGFEPVE